MSAKPNWPSVAGADGCRAGWVAVSREGSGPVEARVLDSADSLAKTFIPDHFLVVDVPIGLPDRGLRQADRLARQRLGWPRMTSVFSAPVRGVLAATCWEEATAIRRGLEGKGLARQVWNIVPGIREMDAVVRALDPRQERIFEGHPEVSFAAWRGAPIREGKKSREGRLIRERLIEAHFGVGVVARLWAAVCGQGVAHDDLLDAFAVLWTAERVAAGRAEELPVEPERDACGLRMEIVV
jgi:predicted RNase H-like nuclease